MKPNRLDDIFQVKCGVPIIAGFYIGMEEDKASELMTDLTDYKIYHSCEYPADLIYQHKISFKYESFNDSYKVSSIEVAFPKGVRNEMQLENVKQYISEKYFNVDSKEYIIRDDQNEIVNYEVTYFEFFYQYTITTDFKELKIIISAKLLSSDIYCAINTISQNCDLSNFIRNSMKLCKQYDHTNKDFAEVMPIYYGMPGFLYFKLGDEGIKGEYCGYLDDLEEDKYCNNIVCQDYNIRYEITQGAFECIDSIIICIPKESDGLWPLVRYIKENVLVEESEIEIINDDDDEFDLIKGYMRNKYLSISFDRPYYATNDEIYITISAIDEDHPEIYQALYTTFTKEYIAAFFNGVNQFYKYNNPTQDAKFNDLRRKFDSFEDAANYYTGEHSAWARDMGGYSKEECERDTAACL